MSTRSAHQITHLLRAWSDGESQALEKLTPLVYRELHRAARRYMGRERPNHTLQATALINEVYLRLAHSPEVGWQDRAHFFAVSARLMRRILTDFARSRRSFKRGGDAQRLSFEESLFVGGEPQGNFAALDDALNNLEKLDQRKSQVVEFRFFGGLSVKETSEVLKVSEETVKRDWKMAKLWLLRELKGENSNGS